MVVIDIVLSSSDRDSFGYAVHREPAKDVRPMMPRVSVKIPHRATPSLTDLLSEVTRFLDTCRQVRLYGGICACAFG